MDEFDYKLAQNNPIVIVKAVKSLIDKLRSLNGDKHKNEFESHLKYLKHKCLYSNNCVAITAMNGIISLCQDENFPLDEQTLMKDFIAALSNNLNIHSLIHLIFYVLTVDTTDKYGMMNNQHPLISIITKEPKMWPIVLTNLDKSLANDEQFERSLYPFITFVLYDYDLKMNDSFQLKLLESFKNSKMLFDKVIIFKKNYLHRSLQYCKVLLKVNNGYIPYISLNLLESLQNEVAPIDAICALKDHVASNSDGYFHVDLLILCECMHFCSVVDLADILLTCKQIMCTEKNPPHIINIVKSLVIYWKLQFPIYSKFTQRVYETINSILKSSFESSDIKKPKHRLFSNQKLYLFEQMAENEASLEMLESLNEAPIEVLNRLFIYLLGSLYANRDPEITEKALELLLRCVDHEKTRSSQLLPVILYKLASTEDSFVNLALIQALPKMGVMKENLSTVIVTLKAISKSTGALKTVVLSAFYELFCLNARCFSYLQIMLKDENVENRSEYLLTKAFVLKELCRKNVSLEIVGTELTVYLSNILNLKTSEYGRAHALAFQGLKYLCRHDILDIASAWNNLAPRFENETNVNVIKSICDLISEVPNLSSSGPRYDNMISDVCKKLWEYTMESPEEDVVKAAYQALGAFSIERIMLSLPDCYNQEKYDGAFGYVSGTCWINLLIKGNRKHMRAAGDLIQALAIAEVKSFRKGIYEVHQTQGEPASMNLPKHSIIGAVTKYIRVNAESWRIDPTVYTECMRIVSTKFSKPLPHMDWSFLKHVIQAPNVAEYCIDLASHQVALSGSARKQLETVIAQLSLKSEFCLTFMSIFKNLYDLCNSIQPMLLKPFVETSLQMIIEGALQEKPDFMDHLVLASKSLKSVLESSESSGSNQQMLTDILMYSVENLDHNEKVFDVLLDCIVVLPMKYLNELSCPRQYDDLSARRFERCLKIRCSATLQRPDDIFLFLNSFIGLKNVTIALQSGSNTNIEFEAFCKWFKLVFVNMRSHQRCAEWLMELMAKILLELADSRNVNNIVFMCTTFVVAVNFLSGFHVFKSNCKQFAEFFECFPYALQSLLKTKLYSPYLSQVLEWLYDVSWNRRYTRNGQSKVLTDIFKTSLLVLRNEDAFNAKYKWMQYLEVEL